MASGDRRPVVAENRRELMRVKKNQGVVTAARSLIDARSGGPQLRVEIINPEFAEVARHDVKGRYSTWLTR